MKGSKGKKSFPRKLKALINDWGFLTCFIYISIEM
jgi:hypothetical protein